MLRGLVILAALGAAVPAWAGEQLFTGQVQKIVMRLPGVGGCAPKCPAAEPDGRGVTPVCISNDGGCQTTEIKVGNVFLGGVRPGSTITVESRIGEWGRPVFSVSPAPVLVSLNGDVHQYADLVERDGKVFVLKYARRVVMGGVPLQKRAADVEDMVSLDDLLARIRARH